MSISILWPPKLNVVGNGSAIFHARWFPSFIRPFGFTLRATQNTILPLFLPKYRKSVATHSDGFGAGVIIQGRAKAGRASNLREWCS